MEHLPPLPGKNSVRVEPEGKRVTETIARVLEAAHQKYPDLLAPSEGENFTPEDVQKVQEFLLTAFPDGPENFRTHSHLQTTGRFAAAIAERTGEHNPSTLHIMGLLHDVGRLLTHPDGVNPHRYFRNDLLGDVLMKKLGLPRKFFAILQPHASYLHPERFQRLEDFSPEQRILILADICGKKKDDGSIKPFRETLHYHYESRNKLAKAKDGPWASENAATRIVTPALVDQWGQLYESMVEWLQSTYGIDIEEVCRVLDTEA